MRLEKTRFTLVVAIISALLLAIAGLFLLASKLGERTLNAALDERALSCVSQEAWSRLRVGMTKREVVALLGESQSKGQTSVTIDGKEARGPEYWEYGWTDGFTIFGGASDKAHAVFFDAKGKVDSFRKPITENVRSASRTAREPAERVASISGYLKSITVDTPVSDIEAKLNLLSPVERRAPASLDPVWRFKYYSGELVIVFAAELKKGLDESSNSADFFYRKQHFVGLRGKSESVKGSETLQKNGTRDSSLGTRYF